MASGPKLATKLLRFITAPFGQTFATTGETPERQKTAVTATTVRGGISVQYLLDFIPDCVQNGGYSEQKMRAEQVNAARTST
jgi:hypothetical protein